MNDDDRTSSEILQKLKEAEENAKIERVIDFKKNKWLPVENVLRIKCRTKDIMNEPRKNGRDFKSIYNKPNDDAEGINKNPNTKLCLVFRGVSSSYVFYIPKGYHFE